MGLLPEAAAVTGSITLDGQELLGLGDRRMSAIRGRDLAMVFQDPLSSLTSIFSIGRQIVEALEVHGRMEGARARAQPVELLDLVGIPSEGAGRRLPARVLRGNAPARGDRDGHRQRPKADHRR